MFGEFFVSQYADEQQMTLTEGQTVNYTRDIRSVDLAVTTLRQDHDDVLAIPMEVNGEFTRFAQGEKVQLDDLTFDIEVLQYYKNSELEAAPPQGANLATKGVGTRLVAREAPPKSGVERGRYRSGLGLRQAHVQGTRRRLGDLPGLPAFRRDATRFECGRFRRRPLPAGASLQAIRQAVRDDFARCPQGRLCRHRHGQELLLPSATDGCLAER